MEGCLNIVAMLQVLGEESWSAAEREGSEMAYAGRGNWMHRKKHSKCQSREPEADVSESHLGSCDWRIRTEQLPYGLKGLL